MTTSETFFTSSGSSPPMDEPSLPPELIEALATLLADALVADIHRYPNLAEVQTNQEPTVESPSGLNRRPSPRTPRPASRSRSRAATPSGPQEPTGVFPRSRPKKSERARMRPKGVRYREKFSGVHDA